MRFTSPPQIARWLYRDAIWKFPSSEGRIFLTIDDGPSDATPEILDLLDRHNIKATFFCTGKQVEKYPDYFIKILAKGHGFGQHGYSHLNGFSTSTKKYVDDVKKAAAIIPSNLFRPPYGKITPWQYSALKNDLKIVFWDVMTYDFDDRMSGNDCLKLTMKNARPGSVVVMHDNPKCVTKIDTIISGMIRTLSL